MVVYSETTPLWYKHVILSCLFNIYFNRKLSSMDINEIAERSAASTFLEGFMVDNGDTQTVDKDAWKASLQEDENIRKLAVGAIIVSEMRDAVLKETQFTCSAGIAHNKVRQILQHPSVDSFFILLLLSNL